MDLEKFILFNPVTGSPKDIPEGAGNYFVVLKEGHSLPDVGGCRAEDRLLCGVESRSVSSHTRCLVRAALRVAHISKYLVGQGEATVIDEDYLSKDSKP